MNEDRKVPTLEKCLEGGEEGVIGRVFQDGYAIGLYAVKHIKTEGDKPLADGGVVKSLVVSYWDFRDRPSQETEFFDVQSHYGDKVCPAELVLMAVQTLPNMRTHLIRGSTSILIGG
jgi:hypothetical protein